MNQNLRLFIRLLILLGPFIVGAVVGGWFGSRITEQIAVAHFASNPYASYMDVEPYHPIVEYGMMGTLIAGFFGIPNVVYFWHRWTGT